jgi:hypothetical protein
MKIWKKFDFLWSSTRYAAVKNFSAMNPDWVAFEERLDECQECKGQLEQLADYFDFGAIRIISGKIRAKEYCRVLEIHLVS